MVYDILTLIESYLSSYSLDSLSEDSLCTVSYDCIDDGTTGENANWTQGSITGTNDLAYKSLNEDCSTYDNEPEDTSSS